MIILLFMKFYGHESGFSKGKWDNFRTCCSFGIFGGKCWAFETCLNLFSDSNFWNFFRFHASSSLIIQYLATDDSKDSTVVIPLLVDFGGHENILPQGEGWLQIYGSRVSKSHLAYTAGKSWIWKCLGISFSDFQFGNFVFIVIYLLHWSSSTGLPWANVVVLWFCLGGTWGWVQYCIFTGKVW